MRSGNSSPGPVTSQFISFAFRPRKQNWIPLCLKRERQLRVVNTMNRTRTNAFSCFPMLKWCDTRLGCCGSPGHVHPGQAQHCPVTATVGVKRGYMASRCSQAPLSIFCCALYADRDTTRCPMIIIRTPTVTWCNSRLFWLKDPAAYTWDRSQNCPVPATVVCAVIGINTNPLWCNEGHGLWRLFPWNGRLSQLRYA